ncbi:hypothetical protein [Streptomyces exfoliatus]|uniref:hypothetical protein n=1 Tax=Streptomyces exfoliatus TaxID=1905 RepID=UPI0004C70D20|nr:hypothetical protein [Streptomyces exfoliatus]
MGGKHARVIKADEPRTHTAVAAEARKGDAKARRAGIIEGFYHVVEDDLAYLKDDTYDLVEGFMGAPVRYNVNRLPAEGRKALVTSLSAAATTLARLEASTETWPPVRRGRAGTSAGLGSWRGLR